MENQESSSDELHHMDEITEDQVVVEPLIATNTPLDAVEPQSPSSSSLEAESSTSAHVQAAAKKSRQRDSKAIIAKAQGLKKDMRKGFYLLGGLQIASFVLIGFMLFSMLQMQENQQLNQQEMAVTLKQFRHEGMDMQNDLKADLRQVNASITYFQQLLASQHDEKNLFLKILILSNKVEPELAKSIARYVKYYAGIYKLDADMVLAIMAYESAFNPVAVSSVGAVGLMQILPQWKPVLGIADSLKNPETAIKFGMQIFGMYLKMYGDTELALTAYNRGPGPVDVNLLRGKDPRNGYAARVMKIYHQLSVLNGKQDPRVDIIALARAEAKLAKLEAAKMKLNK
ncbi:MAG: transglycosylase SLT domain-containing protein [Pseudomonadales bacterium]|nr:transglycosylase SLT domain-containing protein [Pseudomonadales bacterium]